MPEDFSVPYLPETEVKLSPKRASEDAFYATAMSNTDTPIETFESTKLDLIETGSSDFVNAEQRRYEVETDAATREAIQGIVMDDTLDPQLKRAVLQSYALTGALAKDLKTRYITRTASMDTSVTEDDRETQDAVVEALPVRLEQNEKDNASEKVVSGSQSLWETLTSSESKLQGKDPLATGEAILTIGANIAMSIPAGIAGIFELIKEQNLDKAIALQRTIQDLAYRPKEEATQEIIREIMDVAHVIGIPAQTIGNYINEETGSPMLATVGEIVLDPLNWIPLGIARRAVRATPKIPKDSVLRITERANPAQAEEIAAKAVEDPSGGLAEAVQADKGAIIQDWYLPKPMPETVAEKFPDLTRIIKENDTKIRDTFADFRYDPTIINATAREATVERMVNVIRESRAPYYNQAMSFMTETDQLWSGKSYFGRKSSSGYVRESAAKKAMATLEEQISLLPLEERGALSIEKIDNEHFIKWEWHKEYDEVTDKVFGADSIDTRVLGWDASALSRSSLGRWIFPMGRFPKWTEQGAIRGIERSAHIRSDLTKTISKHLAGTGLGKELDGLINKAEEGGIDYFSPDTIARMYPHLSTQKVNTLFETHVLWNRQQHYNHNFMNREQRHRLVSDKMSGLYDKAGNYIGAATDKVSTKELEDILEVWDFNQQRGITLEEIPVDSVFVRLAEKITVDDKVWKYAYADGARIKLDYLPQQVLSRIPGYSGRKVKDSYYIDVTPTKLFVNGKQQKGDLTEFTQTKAAARTEAEADALALQLQKDFPEHNIKVRPERQESWGRVLTDFSIHQEMLRHSMKRGERLPSSNGPARIEDRMKTLISTTNTLSRMGAFRAWDTAFQSAFVKGFPEFTKGEFPKYATDIHPQENMSRAQQVKFKNANALFKYYERMKNTTTRGDFIYTEALHTIADVLEKWKLPVDALRGPKTNPLMLAKTVATLAYIHLAPVRQWVLQPAQQFEMNLINPRTFKKNVGNTAAIMMHFASEHPIMKKFKPHLQPVMKQLGEFAGEKEFLDVVNAISRSGLMQSVDMNSIVHGMLKEVDRHLVENGAEKVWKSLETAAKLVPRASRTVGFDWAELTNRVGNWLQIKDRWVALNPDKSWKTKEAQEEISAEAFKLSGAMSRAGQLPYQEGMLSIFFQFAAINHKLLLNTLQDNATILSPLQRAKIAAVRLPLYGASAGIPGGAIAYYFIEQSEDDDVKDAAELIRRGGVDYAANKLLAALVEPDVEPDLAIGHIMSPYSEGFMPYFQVGWETMKLFDDNPANPRYPAFGMISAFGEMVEDWRGIWIANPVTPETFQRMAFEAAELASGANGYIQGKLMLSMRDKITKMGNKYGMEFTAIEAYAKMVAGITTGKEQELWKIVELENDIKSQKKAMARMIYRQLANQRVKGNEENYEDRVRKVNSFLSMLDGEDFSKMDKLDIIAEIQRMDERNYVTIKQSILVDHWKYHQDERTTLRMQIDDKLKYSKDPQTQKYLKALNEGKL